MYWELWDIKSKNLVETFDSEDEGLQGVRQLLAVNRPDLVDDLVLGAAYDEDESQEIPLPPVLTGIELRAHLAESAPAAAADEATRAIHDKIRRWLAEERWQVRDVDDSSHSLSMSVRPDVGGMVHIFHHKEHVDHLTIALNLTFSETRQTERYMVPLAVQRRILRDIEHDSLIIGLGVQMLGISPIHVLYSTSLYFDGISKDSLIEKVHLVLRAVSLSRLAIVRHVEDAGISPEIAEEVAQPDNVLPLPSSRMAAS